MMIKRAFLPVVASALIAVGAVAIGPTWFWVTLYDGGKAVQVWVTTEEPKVSGDTCRFVPHGQKNVTVIHGVFSVSTQPPINMPTRDGAKFQGF